ncbi:SDR family NAD(P)-dependent oxidoreductase [Acidithiobacillus ferriphilus]|uniref:SDR family NAD(P)-dependent oxidoreductase n=1 Tax=Acidithiobacillus ferriphilus TaxID=1689834 RepID=UPI00232E8560|nr:SDR family oxidoreductase [Acidithiobacillus ferriphilus]WCE93922.1 SDR family NAD(P)-dependent oxidoreductase [Acidithiobacillus ferriphilus]
MQELQKTLLLFGASGAIGSTLSELFSARGWRVVGVSRVPRGEWQANQMWIVADPVGSIEDDAIFDVYAPYQAVCWAQGANLSDSVYDVEEREHLLLYQTNCLFILATLKRLLQRHLLASPARLCIVSSIWQDLARQNKLSYAMTKSALRGLVLSAAADLAAEGHLVNAILPGAMDTPMTRRNLTSEQIDKLTGSTQFGRLPQLEDVSKLAYYLCSEENTGITGQFIAADLGFSHVRIL